MNYLLDTNIIIIYARDNAIAQSIEAKYQLFSGAHNLSISVVTLGELKAIERKFRYGAAKKARIKELLDQLLLIDINIEDVIDRYAEIDAFSQGKHESIPSNFSARNMGKNDIWIAATASAFDAVLVTTDKDFEHLDKVFLDLQWVKL